MASTNPDTKQFLDSTPLLDNAHLLRERAQAEGYLFFKGLLPAPDLLQVRRDILAVVRDFGWLTGTDAWDGRLDLEKLNLVPEEQLRTDIGVSHECYHAVQKLESVHRLPHHSTLLGLFAVLLDGEPLVHPRHIIRMVTAHQSMVPTPPHQDFPLIQGTPETWTCWFPVGACPRSMGALTVLRGSHKKGYLPISAVRGAGGLAAQLCQGEDDWVEADFALGDVLVFPSFTVHKALPSVVKDQIRLSFDVRYQCRDQQVEALSLLPHCELTWQEIYADWERQDLQYYWESLPLQHSSFDESLHIPGRRIC